MIKIKHFLAQILGPFIINEYVDMLHKKLEHQRNVFYSVPQPDLVKQKFESFKTEVKAV